MAGGVIAALAAQGLAGKVPVSGQDGDTAALNRVALGTQTVDVWKDARAARQGRRRGRRPALQRTRPSRRKMQPSPDGPVQEPRWQRLTSILLTPQPITKDNLKVVLDAGWITKDRPLPGRHGAAPPRRCYDGR